MQKLLNQPTRQLLKCPSIPVYQESAKFGTSSTIYTSCSSIESVDDESRKSAIKWLMEFDRKITKDTNYLSVWYLEIVLRNGLLIKESNWQVVAGAIMMFASKMNQIYPPSVSSILKRCRPSHSPITKEALIQMEGKILNLLDFDVAIQSPFNLISQILRDSKKDIEECQKLLKIIIYNKQINQQESEILAYAIIYLIARAKIDVHIQGEIRTKVKVTAQKIYNYYKDVKKNHDSQKSKAQSSENEQKISPKQIDLCTSKENTNTNAELFSSVGSYTKADQTNIKKAQQNYIQLNRANSYKFIPRQKPFAQTTNVLDKQKKLFHCVSKDQLKGSFKNLYLYS